MLSCATFLLYERTEHSLTGREQQCQLLTLDLLLTLDQRVLKPNDDNIVFSLVGLGGSSTRGRDLDRAQGVSQ